MNYFVGTPTPTVSIPKAVISVAPTGGGSSRPDEGKMFPRGTGK